MYYEAWNTNQMSLVCSGDWGSGRGLMFSRVNNEFFKKKKQSLLTKANRTTEKFKKREIQYEFN